MPTSHCDYTVVSGSVITIGQVVGLYIIMCARGGVRQDHVQQLLLMLHSFHYGVYTWPQQMVEYIDLFRSCLQSTSYILVETVLCPAAPWRYNGIFRTKEQHFVRCSVNYTLTS